jgi:hypothetical protein
MNNKKLNTRRLIFEFISVTFAVLFALFVSQWRENYNNDKLADKAILNIGIELEKNKEDISLSIPKHKSALAYIDSLLLVNENSDLSINEPISIELMIMSSSAWEMSEITNAIYYLDFEDVNDLAKVYDLQSYYESIVKHYILNSSIVYQPKTGIIRLKNNKQFLETIIPIEESLKIYYDRMLAEVLKKE